jgi:P4 family phage/plasmid primase-like protien
MFGSAIEELVEYLEKRRVKKKGGIFTHLGMGGVTKGKYLVEENDVGTFMDKYANALDSEEHKQICLIEKHKPSGPVVIDLDVAYNLTATEGVSTRVFGDEFISQFVGIVSNVLCHLIELHGDSPRIYVLRKPSAPVKDTVTGRYKDGLHIVVPQIITEPKVQHLMRTHALPQLQRLVDATSDSVQIISQLNDIYDESVIQRNGWMMHGSCKPGKEAYKLYQLWRVEGEDAVRLSAIEKRRYDSDYQLVNALSIRQHNAGDMSITTESCQFDLERMKKDEKTKIVDSAYLGCISYYEDIDFVKGIVDLLDASRADSYTQWIHLGLCMHNIDARLLTAWMDFSKCSERYSEAEAVASCEREWQNMRTTPGGLGLGTLIKWAQDDNQLNSRFLHYMQNSLEKSVVECCDKHLYIKGESAGGPPPGGSQHGGSHHGGSNESADDGPLHNKMPKYAKTLWVAMNYYVVRVLHKRWKHQLVCSAPTSKAPVWWEFKGHSWVDCAMGLKKYLNEEAHYLFNNAAQKFHRDFLSSSNLLQQDPKSTELLRKKMRSHKLESACRSLAEGMRHAVNKNTMNSEACGMFYWKDSDLNDKIHKENFEEVLDSNRYLIGLENGVYDLKAHRFREGQCEDYVHMSTKNEWDESFTWQHEQVKDILLFVEQVLPDESVRQYILRLFASFCDGQPEEKFHIFVGSGGNGKSKLIDLFLLAMGDYCGNLPVTALTASRPASNAASPEIERLKGRRFVSVMEPNKHECLQPGRLKELTGGDTIYARALHKEPIEYKPQFNMVLASNVYPAVPADDGGVWRRLKVVPFTSRFLDNPDPNDPTEFKIDYALKDKLAKWGPAFFWMLMQYYEETANTLGGTIPEPDVVKRKTQAYRQQNDHISHFQNDKIVKDDSPDAYVPLNDMYPVYTQWSKCQGYPLEDRSALRDWFVKNWGDTVEIEGKGEGWKRMAFKK